MEHKYTYNCYSKLRAVLKNLFTTILKQGGHESPWFVVSEVGETLDIEMKYPPTNIRLDPRRTNSEDFLIVLNEAFSELTEAEVAEFCRRWKFFKLSRFGTKRFELSELHEVWAKAPHREIEAFEKMKRKAKAREEAWKKVWKWITGTVLGKIVGVIGFLGAVASIVALVLYLLDQH